MVLPEAATDGTAAEAADKLCAAVDAHRLAPAVRRGVLRDPVRQAGFETVEGDEIDGERGEQPGGVVKRHGEQRGTGGKDKEIHAETERMRCVFATHEGERDEVGGQIEPPVVRFVNAACDQ